MLIQLILLNWIKQLYVAWTSCNCNLQQKWPRLRSRPQAHLQTRLQPSLILLHHPMVLLLDSYFVRYCPLLIIFFKWPNMISNRCSDTLKAATRWSYSILHFFSFGWCLVALGLYLKVNLFLLHSFWISFWKAKRPTN